MANKFAATRRRGRNIRYGSATPSAFVGHDGTMFASDIGMDQIEEINIVRNGENYGWMKREGYFEMAGPAAAL